MQATRKPNGLLKIAYKYQKIKQEFHSKTKNKILIIIFWSLQIYYRNLNIFPRKITYY